MAVCEHDFILVRMPITNAGIAVRDFYGYLSYFSTFSILMQLLNV
jgi:hypothetical protein